MQFLEKAFIMWLIMNEKFKTQHKLQEWEINIMIRNVYPLCSQIADSHKRLFFECCFSSQVWLSVRNRANMDLIPLVWSDIVEALKPLANRKSYWNIVGKLVLGSSAYFIWKERNLRIYKKGEVS